MIKLIYHFMGQNNVVVNCSIRHKRTFTTKLKADFDRNFDRKTTKFWPKLDILTEILTENSRSKNVGRNYFLTDRSKILTDFLTEVFGQNNFWRKFWPKISVKIIYNFDRHFDCFFGQNIKFWPKFWPQFSVKIIFWPNFRSKFGQKSIFWPKIRSKFWWSIF